MKVSLLIVSYNTRQLTLDCLTSVFEQTTGIDFEVIVVDNASSDGSAEAIAREFPQVNLIASQKNLGFASANNLAATHAHADTEYLLLLNPDTVVLDRAVVRLVEHADQNPEAGICGGRTLFPDGSLNTTCCWGDASLWTMFCHTTGLARLFPGSRFFSGETMGSWQRDSVMEVDIVTGCLLLIRKPLWDWLAGFDADFFMYGEDADLCNRARELGKKCILFPDVKIIHYSEASEKLRSDKMVRLFSARARLFAKHWSRPASWLAIRMMDIWSWTRTVVFGLLRFVRPASTHSFHTWRHIWRSRRQWQESWAATRRRDRARFRERERASS